MTTLGRLAVLCCIVPVSFVMPQKRSATIEGFVVDAFGTPLVGAPLEVRSADGSLMGAATTDGEGRFILRAIPAGRMELSARFRGFEERRLQVELAADDKIHLCVGLQAGRLSDIPPALLLGAVRRQDGRVVPGALISVRPEFTGRDSVKTETDRTGRYQLTLASYGQYRLTASARGFLDTSVTFVLPPAASELKRTVDVLLSPSN
jgi:hypothetical protein